MNDYLIVEKSALPDYFLKVVEARRLLEGGTYESVSEAVEAVGISRSTYYKYRDRVLEPDALTVGRKATLTLTLADEAGMLSKLLNRLSACGANILTITQSLPVHGRASVMLTMDMAQMRESMENLLESFRKQDGVENVRLLSIE